MTTNYPIFDPAKPEEFKTLYWKQLEALTKKERAAYEKEEAKRDAYVYEQDKIKYTNPAPEENEFSTRVRTSRIISQLAVALREKGFTVEYGIKYQRHIDYPVHESWATMATIYKDGQKVGSYSAWTPSYRHQPEGWEINTIRGKGSRPSSYSNTKRVKLIGSAVGYICQTAIPKVPLEATLKQVEETLTEKKRAANKARSTATTTFRGYSGAGWSGYNNGVYEKLMKAYMEDGADTALAILKEQSELFQTQDMEAKAAEADAAKYEADIVEPLRAEMKKALPEVYS